MLGPQGEQLAQQGTDSSEHSEPSEATLGLRIEQLVHEGTDSSDPSKGPNVLKREKKP